MNLPLYLSRWTLLIWLYEMFQTLGQGKQWPFRNQSKVYNYEVNRDVEMSIIKLFLSELRTSNCGNMEEI
jgi:hypothetical protein